MRPIYKSLALVSTILQVSLALNAQTRDDESASTIALPADLLDSLRVELVALNVSGARNLIESGECVIDGSNLTITLDTSEWTRGAMYRLQVLATFGTHTQVIYALNITVPYYIALSDIPQEYEDDVTVVLTITDVTEADLEGLALEATSQEIKAAITPIAGAAEAYNVGKTQLAQAITSKGVETSPTETYPEMAAKVAQIPQETTIYEGADSYGKQFSADGVLWDLYQVLADMKTRFIGTGDYAALIVCEYYKGYPSLVLQGADGYYTCDGDYYDYASPNHVWHDEDNGKMNRWVAFLYRNEGARLDITNTSISPRSMYIGGHIGTIEYFVDGRLTELVCGIEETDVVDVFAANNYTQEFIYKTILRNIGSVTGLKINNKGFLCIDGVELSTSGLGVDEGIIKLNSEYVYIKLSSALNYSSAAIIDSNAINEDAVSILVIDGECYSTFENYGSLYKLTTSPTIKNKLRILHAYGYLGGRMLVGRCGQLEDVIVGAANRNISATGWDPQYLDNAERKATLISNIVSHILARVSDATGGTQLVFTISTNMYNNIASEQIEWQGETMSLADAFLTKNWLLAGA